MNQKQNITKELDGIALGGAMEYFRKFGGETGIWLSVSDSLCDEPAERLHGLLQTRVPDRGEYDCAYLTPAEMRELASELFNLASIIAAENLIVESAASISVLEKKVAHLEKRMTYLRNNQSEAENLVVENAKPATFNHLMDVAFTIPNSPHENWEDVPATDMLAALEKRVAYLKNNQSEAAEAFGFSDTYEEDTVKE
jgi:hypothetical protein